MEEILKIAVIEGEVTRNKSAAYLLKFFLEALNITNEELALMLTDDNSEQRAIAELVIKFRDREKG